MAVSITPRPPGPRSSLPGVNIFTFRRDPLGYLTRVSQKYGDIAYFKLGPQHVYLLNHPDYIKDVLITHDRKFKKGRILERAKRVVGEGLLTSEGSFHTRQRRLMQPAFHNRRIGEYADAMVDATARWQERWQDGETRDIHAEMMGLALIIVGRTLFGADIQRASAAVGEAMEAFMDVFSFVLLPFSDFLEKLPLPQVRRVDGARRRLDEIIYRLIAERRGSLAVEGKGNDLLSMLLRVQDEEGGTGSMSDEQVRDECVTLVLAGHETTANALTWTWYLLSQHPEIEARLHQEIDSALHGRRPLAEDLPRLRYAEMVFAESMRLYPPAWGLARKALEPHIVAGYAIPRGGVVLMNQYVTHRDPRWYPDPEKFDPDRWAEEPNPRPKFAYFPFGGGPRQCIGEGFAWMEGVLLLTTLAQRWCMRLAQNQRIGLRPVLTLRPKYGMRMVLEARN
jgi:cytochrome P450